MKKTKEIFRLFLIVVVVFATCNILLYRFQFSVGKIEDFEFLFNFLGILLGFALTIFSFIISMIDKIRERLENSEQTTSKTAKQFKENSDSVNSEIKHNIFFIFFSLIAILAVYISGEFKMPSYHIYKEFYVNKVMFVRSFKLTLFMLNVYAIYDLIILSFRISDITGMVLLKKKEK